MKMLSFLRNSVLALGLITGVAHAVPIVYQGTLSNGVTVFGDAPLNSYNNAAGWDFWRFSGNSGDIVTITMNRTTNQMDPGVSLYAGIGGDTAGLIHGGGSSADGLLTHQTYDDDSGTDTPDGPYANAIIFNFALTSGGEYTIAAYDVLGDSTGPWTYALTITGIAAAAQVPEPGSLALLGLGLVGLVAARKRKQA